jgi:SAM-dependent methyltransferase
MDDLTRGRARHPHAVLDRASRIQKAEKIIRLLGQARLDCAVSLLEIGCGSGGIASHIGRSFPRLQVEAVDVVDSRIDVKGYAFQLVDGTGLPFADERFDVVVSNHVIEHVGNENDQLHHLHEIRRVLAPGGVAYLAVPNRWAFLEPHYRLPLLSWLPSRFADCYVRSTRRGSHYDCRPLGLLDAPQMVGRAGLRAENVTARALRELIAIEWPASSAARVMGRSPEALLRLALPIMPTFVYLLHK